MSGLIFKDWNIKEVTGYEPKTTFYMDFSIAERFGTDAIRDTYKRAFKDWKNNIVYLTELVMALNWKIYEHYGKNEAFAKVYNELWEEADGWCMENLKGKEMDYFLSTTD